MKKMLDTMKDFLGVGEDFENDELFVEDEKEKKSNQVSQKKEKEKKGLSLFKIKKEKKYEDELDDELGLDPISIPEQVVEKVLEKRGEEETYQTIFVDPKDFSECKKIANYIKNNQMVTLNLEYLDGEKAQRMMDFLMGAMLVQGATFIEISKKVYTSIPKNMKVHYDGKKDFKDRFFNSVKND